MDIIAFEAKSEKGVIKIPEQYLKVMPSSIKVIVVLTPEEKKRKKHKLEFNTLSIDTKKLKFNRDEANER